MGKRTVANVGVDEVLSALVEAFNSSSSNDRVVFLSEDGQSTTERPDPLEYPRLLSVAEVVVGRKASRANHRLVLTHATGQGQLPAGWTVEYKRVPRMQPLTERVGVKGMPTTVDEVDALIVTESKLWDDAHASDEAIPAAEYAPAVGYLGMLKDGLSLVARMKERDPQDVLLGTLEHGNALWWEQYQASRFRSEGIEETFRVKPETQQRFLRDLKANSDANTRDLYQRLRARQAKDPEGAASIWAEMADELLVKHPELGSVKVAERVDVKDIPTYSVMSYEVTGDTEEELKLVARSIRLVKALTIKSAPVRKGSVFVLPVEAHIPTGSADPAQEGFDLIQSAIQKAGVEEKHARARSGLTEEIAKRTIPIKYMFGKMDWNGQLWSAAAVRQVLAAIQDDLRAVFGEYEWYLDGDTGDYQIIAKSLDVPGLWVDGRGKTPKLAMMDCNATRTILQKNGWLPSNGMTDDTDEAKLGESVTLGRVWHGLHYLVRSLQTEGRYIKDAAVTSCSFEVLIQCGSELQARDLFQTLQKKLAEDGTLGKQWGLGHGWVRGSDVVSVFGTIPTKDEAAEFQSKGGDLTYLSGDIEEAVERMLVQVLGADWEHVAEDDEEPFEESVSKPDAGVAQGLKGWVKDYILARRAGNISLAKSIKANIDREIKKQGLDAHEVYFVFGDPDDPKTEVVTEATLSLRTPPVPRPDSVITIVDVWYDPHIKSWVVQDKDAEGNQVGDSRYYGDKAAAFHDQAQTRQQLRGTGVQDPGDCPVCGGPTTDDARALAMPCYSCWAEAATRWNAECERTGYDEDKVPVTPAYYKSLTQDESFAQWFNRDRRVTH